MRKALFACLVCLLALPAAADTPSVSPEGPVWDTSPGFGSPGMDKRKKLRRSLSGIACPGELNSPRRCIAVFDEGGEAYFATIDGTRLIPEQHGIRLLPGDGELDAEAAATDGSFAYVTGSHSRKRDSCASNPDSRHVYRVALGPGGQAQPPGADDQGRLWRLLSEDPELSPFVDKCLGKHEHGTNIEGLAARNGQLYFGFREPARNKKAYILRVAANALFDGGDLNPRLFTLEAGPASGIRDLLAVPEGLLVLVGPDDDSKDGIPWWLGFWNVDDPSTDIALRHLAELKLPTVTGGDCDREIKPEAMTMLQDGSDFRRMLILSDGMCDGGPLSFRIPK